MRTRPRACLRRPLHAYTTLYTAPVHHRRQCAGVCRTVFCLSRSARRRARRASVATRAFTRTRPGRACRACIQMRSLLQWETRSNALRAFGERMRLRLVKCVHWVPKARRVKITGCIPASVQMAPMGSSLNRSLHIGTLDRLYAHGAVLTVMAIPMPFASHALVILF